MLSGNSTYSCASCHQQSLAFTDGLAQAIGADGWPASTFEHVAGERRLQRVVRMGRSHVEPRIADGSADVQRAPRRDGAEGARSGSHRTIRRGRATTPNAFAPLFPAKRARSRLPTSSRRSRRSSGSSSLQTLPSTGISTRTTTAVCRRPQSAVSALFFSDRLKCSECHGSVNVSGPTMFTGAMPSDPEAFFHDTGVAAQPAKFRAPTLRNIAVTAPYMHDGSVASFEGRGARTTRQADVPASEERQGARVCHLGVRNRRPGGVSAHPH